MSNLKKLTIFDEKSIPSLNEVVLWALELFSKKQSKKLNLDFFKKPLIAWSWNAYVTAKIIFEWTNAIFCDETNFNKYIKKDVDWLIILSASWEKHASIFAKKAKDKNIPTKLLTCNKDSTTWKIIWKENTIVTWKNREPYTYNTSTYLWWILAITNENPKQILNFIKNKIDPILNKTNFSKYDSYLLVTPNRFSWVNQLFNVKFIELFWRKIARDVFSFEHLKHAITVVPHNKELCINFWEENKIHKWNQLFIPVPEDCWLWMMISIWYYTIGKIQNSYPHYFKENIYSYIKNINKKDFWKNLNIIVD